MALLDDIVEEAIRRKQLEAFNQALQEPSSVADRFVFGDPQLEAMEPTTQMQIGEKLQDYLGGLRKTFPEANPYGTAIEDFFLGGSEDLAREMTEGYKAVDFNNLMDANRSIIDPRVPEVISLIPVATGAKLATTIPTEFAATVGPMVAASRMTGRLVDPDAEDTGLLDAITGAGLANQPVSNVGIFAGEIGARNLAQAGDDAAMQALDLAQSMENAGATPIEIWTETAKTGYPVYRGVDGKLRFEIDDSQAGFDKGIIDQLAALRRSAENNPEQAELIAQGYEDVQRGFKHGGLGDVFTHQKAFETYPDVRGAVKARYFDLRDRGLELQNRINELEAGPEYEGRSVDLMNLMDERDAITAEKEALPFIGSQPQGLGKVEYRMPLGLGGGSYHPREDIITVESSVPELDKMDVRDRARSTTLHEMQHAIQQREGFESGSNPAAFKGTSATGEKRVGALDAEKAAQFNQLKNDPSYPGFLRLKDEVYGTDEQKGIYGQANDLYDKEYGNEIAGIENRLASGSGTETELETLRQKQSELYNEYEFRKSELFPEIEEYELLRESLHQEHGMDPAFPGDIDEYIRLDPMQSYGRSAGEVEARLTQKRRDYTPAERAAKPAFEEFDRPVEQQLLRVDKSADPSGFAPVSLMDELSQLSGTMPTTQAPSKAIDEIMEQSPSKIDYEKSQLPRKKVPKRLMELRSDIRKKREDRQSTEPGDKLGKFPDIKTRLEFFKENKKRDAKLVEADKLIAENPLWSKKFAEEIKTQFKTSSEFANLTKAINKANLEAVPRALKKEGWTVRYGSEGRDKRKSSRYIVSPDGAYQIRLSDHDLPSTPDRDMRGVGWDDEIVLDGQQSPSDLIEIIKNRYQNPELRWEDLGNE